MVNVELFFLFSSLHQLIRNLFHKQGFTYNFSGSWVEYDGIKPKLLLEPQWYLARDSQPWIHAEKALVVLQK